MHLVRLVGACDDFIPVAEAFPPRIPVIAVSVLGVLSSNVLCCQLIDGLAMPGMLSGGISG